MTFGWIRTYVGPAKDSNLKILFLVLRLLIKWREWQWMTSLWLALWGINDYKGYKICDHFRNPSDNKIHHLDKSLKSLNIMFAWKGKKWKCLRSTSTCATLTKRWAEMCKPLVHNEQQIFVKEDVERVVILKWVRTKRRSGWGAESGRLFRTSLSSHPTKTGPIEDPWLECEIQGFWSRESRWAWSPNDNFPRQEKMAKLGSRNVAENRRNPGGLS